MVRHRRCAPSWRPSPSSAVLAGRGGAERRMRRGNPVRARLTQPTWHAGEGVMGRGRIRGKSCGRASGGAAEGTRRSARPLDPVGDPGGVAVEVEPDVSVLVVDPREIFASRQHEIAAKRPRDLGD
jgi:hypothetical protein